MNRFSAFSASLFSVSLALIVLSASPLRAQEGELVKNVLGNIGLIDKDAPRIDYRERAPLVLPPRMELRQPLDPQAVHARNPQWPNDPDVAALRKADAEARVPVTETERRRLEQNPTLSIAEIRAGRRPGAEIPDGPVIRRGDNSREDIWINPDVLRSQGRLESSAETLPGEEPERRNLTQPPSGFRKPAAGAPMKATAELPSSSRDEEADPKAYLRQQRRRAAE